MDENSTEKDSENKRNKKWEIAFTARMRQIVPGLFLGNVEASYKRDLLQRNRINATVSFTDARWVWWNTATREVGIPEHRHRWVQCADSSTQDLLAYAIFATSLTKWHLLLFPHCPPCLSTTKILRMMSQAVYLRRRY